MNKDAKSTNVGGGKRDVPRIWVNCFVDQETRTTIDMVVCKSEGGSGRTVGRIVRTIKPQFLDCYNVKGLGCWAR